jgi:hypothetical protein
MLWNEAQCLDMAPGQHATPINIMYNSYAGKLSFPAIYYGVYWQFSLDTRVTPYMIANSEISRSDRREVTPDHILYIAMKILRMRVLKSINNIFRCVRQTDNITPKMLEDKTYFESCMDKNLAFIKSIPNSVQY